MAVTSEATQGLEPSGATGFPCARSPLANRDQAPTATAEGLKFSRDPI